MGCLISPVCRHVGAEQGVWVHPTRLPGEIEVTHLDVGPCPIEQATFIVM